MKKGLGGLAGSVVFAQRRVRRRRQPCFSQAACLWGDPCHCILSPTQALHYLDQAASRL